MPTKERGTLLTVWLILLLAANAGTVLLYLLLMISPAGRLFLEGVPVWAVYVFIFGGVFNLICTFSLFLWKKWALFGLCASAGIALAVNLYIGVGAVAFLGLGAAVMTYLVLRPKWALFDDF